MKRITMAAITASCALAVALAGCSGPAQPTQSVSEDDLKGFWQLEESSQLGFDAVLNLEDEGLAEFMMADGFLEGTWSTDGTNAQVVFNSEDDSWELEVEGEDDESASADAAASDAAASSDASASEQAAASSDAASGEESSASAEASADSSATTVGKIFVSDGKLTLGTADGSRLVFVKGDINEYFGDEGDDAGGAATLDSISLDDMEAEVVEPVIEDMSPVVVTDNDTVSIHVTGKGTDYLGEPCYRLSVKNKTKKAIDIESSDDVFKVGDAEVEGVLGDIVEAGETLETYLSFSKDEVASVDKLKKVTGAILVSDDDSGDEIATYDFKVD